jgi:hypothetical protein
MSIAVTGVEQTTVAPLRTTSAPAGRQGAGKKVGHVSLVAQRCTHCSGVPCVAVAGAVRSMVPGCLPMKMLDSNGAAVCVGESRNARTTNTPTSIGAVGRH